MLFECLQGQLVLVRNVVTPKTARHCLGNILSLRTALKNFSNLCDIIENTLSVSGRGNALLKSMREWYRNYCFNVYIVVRSLSRPEFSTTVKLISGKICERYLTKLTSLVIIITSALSQNLQQQHHNHECFAVKAGVDGMLDVSRQTYLDDVATMETMVHRYSVKYNVEVQLAFWYKTFYSDGFYFYSSWSRGFHINCRVADEEDIPDTFIRKSRKNKCRGSE